jgi:hypothetical protein
MRRIRRRCHRAFLAVRIRWGQYRRIWGRVDFICVWWISTVSVAASCRLNNKWPALSWLSDTSYTDRPYAHLRKRCTRASRLRNTNVDCSPFWIDRLTEHWAVARTGWCAKHADSFRHRVDSPANPRNKTIAQSRQFPPGHLPARGWTPCRPSRDADTARHRESSPRGRRNAASRYRRRVDQILAAAA